MKLRIGILSTASIVPRLIGAVRSAETSACSGFTISAIASRDLEKARQKAKLWNIPEAFGSYEELIASDAADVIYIATVNSEHTRFTRLALEAGKHVLCEKPFALYPDEAASLFALARKKDRFLMEMQKVVFLPVVQKLKELIQNGTLGRITMADFSSSFDPGYNAWFFDAAKGGGPLYSNAGYSLQLMQYLFDCYADAWTGLCTKSSAGVEDQFAAVLHMENGILFTNKTSTAAETLHTGLLYGEKGYAELPDYWKARKAILHYPGQEPVVLEYPCEYELVYEVRHAEECIRSGLTESPVMTEEMTVRTARTLAALHELWNPSEKSLT